MDDLHEVKEPRKAISSEEWREFLTDFAMRNNNRRARFDFFKSNGETSEEGQESYLEDIVLKGEGANISIEIIRIDRSNANAEKNEIVITNVRGVSVQYDTDGSEDALEITDDQNSLISLRLESKVDGNS